MQICSHVITVAIELTRHMHACINIAESTELAKACRHASAIPPALHKWINFHRFDKVNYSYLARCMAPTIGVANGIKSCDQIKKLYHYIATITCVQVV